MSRTKRLLVRVDATPESGLGHVVRASGIVDAMTERPELVVAGAGDALRAYFSDAKIVRPSGQGIAAMAALHHPDAVLVDLPRYDDGALPPRTAETPPLILIDDWGGGMDADLIICGSVRNTPRDYPAVTDASRILTGPAHCLVRPAFGRTPWRGEGGAGVAVVAGGGPRAQAWLRLLTGPDLDRNAWGSVTIVVGPTFRELDALADRCESAGTTLRIGVGADELATIFTRARVALVTGGMTVYEALTVGIPTVVFPQLANLVEEAAWFSERGCIESLGFDGGTDARAISAAVARLLTDQALAKHMSEQARRLIDGRGMMRAAAAITNLLAAPKRSN